MHTEVATKLVVTEAAFEVSQAISMAGANAVSASATCLHWERSGGISPKFRVTVDQSNDLQNWTDISELTASKTIEFSAEGQGSLLVTGIAAAYVRLHYAWVGNPTTSMAIVAADLNTSDL